jgi:hypothetical protein
METLTFVCEVCDRDSAFRKETPEEERHCAWCAEHPPDEASDADMATNKASFEVGEIPELPRG